MKKNEDICKQVLPPPAALPLAVAAIQRYATEYSPQKPLHWFYPVVNASR